MRRFLALCLTLPVLAACAGPARPPDHPAEEMAWVPMRDSAGAPKNLRARICRPEGSAPAPVAVINHGAPPDAAETGHMEPTRCDSGPARWFLARGYIVVFALRRGFGASTGPVAESSGPCDAPDYFHAAMEGARDIDAVVRYAAALPFARADDIVVLGQSTGGLATIAYDSMPYPGVVGLISMAGGRGGHAFGAPRTYCHPEALVAAAGKLGEMARLPMLWVSAANDTYFEPGLEQAMRDAFVAAGGVATLAVVPPFGGEGHFLFYGQGGDRVWGPLLSRYLDERRAATASGGVWSTPASPSRAIAAIAG